MTVNRLIWKSWLCMFFAIRLLTLVAFTAHAVLGCCLSHGSCMREQAAIFAGHCCSHDDDLRDAHESCEGHSHDADVVSETINGTACITSGCEVHPTRGQGHSNHCDDPTCTFGVSTNTSNAATWQFFVVVNWIDTSAGFWLKPSLDSGFARCFLDTLPKATQNRAVNQVWLL